MKKCAICEKIYDESTQKAYLKELDTGKIMPISNIERPVGTEKLIYSLCPQCMRMFLFSGMFFDNRFHNMTLVSEDEIAKEKPLSLPTIKW